MPVVSATVIIDGVSYTGPLSAPIVTPPVVVPPVVVPPPVVAGAVAWKTLPHNDWTDATKITLNGNAYFMESAEKPYSAQMSTNTTTPIFRGEVRNNELWTGDMGGNDTERAELDGTSTLYPKGTEFWLSYQFKIEPGGDQIAASGGFPGGPLSWGCVGQIHGEGGSLPAVPWQLSIVGDKLSVRTQKGQQEETVHWTSAGKYARDKVYSVVVKIKITGALTSALTVWIDGVQVCQVSNKVIGGNDPSFYPKFGIYRGWQGDGYPNFAVQVANIEHGKASLLGRVAQPLDWPKIV